jgi:hypothetical protein
MRDLDQRGGPAQVARDVGEGERRQTLEARSATPVS